MWKSVLLGSLLFCIFKVVWFWFFFLHFFCSCFSFSPGIGTAYPETPIRRMTDCSASFLHGYLFSLTREKSFVATGEVPLLLDVALKLLGGKLT